ncbi:hypothetical protein B484DRAFT_405579, partial [Ochromonadaceae sp. CCMP2298]
ALLGPNSSAARRGGRGGAATYHWDPLEGRPAQNLTHLDANGEGGHGALKQLRDLQQWGDVKELIDLLKTFMRAQEVCEGEKSKNGVGLGDEEDLFLLDQEILDMMYVVAKELRDAASTLPVTAAVPAAVGEVGEDIFAADSGVVATFHYLFLLWP